MITRNVRGRPVGLDRARPARVVSCTGDAATLVAADGGELRLSTAPDGVADRGVAAIPRAIPYEVGDVVIADPSGGVELLVRESWMHNSILVTERCNSRCVMCSQPPREVDDSGRVATLIEATRLFSPATRSIGITGGEPSLLGGRLVDFVGAIGAALPEVSVHILSNGRGFKDAALARALGALKMRDVMVGIPLYADHDDLHDEVVVAPGAFGETMQGIEHLARAGVPVEIRVVLHRMTVGRLVELCEFIYRNMPYVAHVALMGLEPIGFAVPNLRSLWVDPVDYADTLARAVFALRARGMRPRIYNVQLCTLPEGLWPYARQSISEWKNEYLPACEGCVLREQCCGFFASAVSRSVVSRALEPLCVVVGE